MRKLKNLFGILLCTQCCFINEVFSQTNKIEILKAAIDKTIDPSKKLDAILVLCEESHSLNVDSLYHFANLAKQMADALHDDKRKMLANTFIETWLGRKNLFDSALKICNSDLKNITYNKDADVYSKTMMQKCHAVMKTHRYKEALEEAYRFLQEAENHGDTVSEIYCKFIIGNVYRDMDQTDLALQWFLKADRTSTTEAFEEKKNEFGIYFLLGMMYNWKNNGDVNPDTARADSLVCLDYLDLAIRGSRRFENLAMLARALNVKAANIGNKEHVMLEGKYVEEAKHIYEQLHDTLSMLNSISPMCFYYIDDGHPEKGIKLCEEGLEMIKRGNEYPTLDLYESMSQCYKSAGQYQKYADVLDTIIKLKDGLYKKNSERDLADLNAKYEDQKKENTIIQQELDIAAKKNTTYVVSIISGILLIILVFLYRYYYKRQKQQKQKEIIAIAAAEEAERRRISADLHDNIGAYAAAAASTIATIDPKDAKSKNTLLQLKDNVQDMITQLNDSIWALNKKSVLLTGISDRFKLFVQKLEFAYPEIDILINEEINYDRVLSPFQALHLFRIMQEALNNALRHSKCNEVTIHIKSDEKILQISIVDNGIGMHGASFNGNGINNLKTRAKESGWNAEWISNNDVGTSVIISTEQIENTTN